MLPGDYNPFYFRFQCNDDYDSNKDENKRHSP